MKLLLITQKVDKNDDLLGFVHGWIGELAKKYEKLTVICLFCGAYDLPQNVRVLSLGKEKTRNFQFSIFTFQFFRKVRYAIKFYEHILRERKNYDRVFVHMNQEYILLGGIFWKLMGKKIYFWRNHPNGNFLTDIAAWLSDKIFCVSGRSYTAKFKKTVLMPAGIDAELFHNLQRANNSDSILFFGRISPVKKIEILLKALEVLKKENIDFSCSIVGNAPERDKGYYDSLLLEAKNAELKISWQLGVPYSEAPKIFNQAGIFVNLTSSGSFDKTTLEAMACERLCLVSNRSYEGKIKSELIFGENSASDLAEKLKWALSLSEQQRDEIGKELRRFAQGEHSLESLIEKLAEEIK